MTRQLNLLDPTSMACHGDQCSKQDKIDEMQSAINFALEFLTWEDSPDGNYEKLVALLKELATT